MARGKLVSLWLKAERRKLSADRSPMTKPKETSDSLAHPVVEPAHVVVPARRRTGADYAALAIATCGVGFIPVAPGTWGSGVGVLLYLALGLAA
jgi:hypothetical protein